MTALRSWPDGGYQVTSTAAAIDDMRRRVRRAAAHRDLRGRDKGVRAMGMVQSITREQGEEILERHGYKLVPYMQFEFEADTALRERARLCDAAHKGENEWVVYDPHDDADGWLMLGDDPMELIVVTCGELLYDESFELLTDEGPLE